MDDIKSSQIEAFDCSPASKRRRISYSIPVMTAVLSYFKLVRVHGSLPSNHDIVIGTKGDLFLANSSNKVDVTEDVDGKILNEHSKRLVLVRGSTMETSFHTEIHESVWDIVVQCIQSDLISLDVFEFSSSFFLVIFLQQTSFLENKSSVESFLPSSLVCLRELVFLLHPSLEVCWKPKHSDHIDPVSTFELYTLFGKCKSYEETKCQNRSHDDVFLRPIDNLVPTLRLYQQAAVHWMLYREQTISFGNESNFRSHAEIFGWVLLGKHYSRFGGKPFWYNMLSCSAALELPKLHKEIPEIRGGILAEEMGLGKSVELIACILANPLNPTSRIHNKLLQLTSKQREKRGNNSCDRKLKDFLSSSASSYWNVIPRHTSSESKCICGSGKRNNTSKCKWVICRCCEWHLHIKCAGSIPTQGHYICVSCKSEAFAKSPIKSGCTLIVCPPAILSQWKREFEVHVKKKLNILIYPGVAEIVQIFRRRKYQSNASDFMEMLDPIYLSKRDVILTTYDVIRAEIHHVGTYKESNKYISLENRSLRRPKAYKTVSSPLMAVLWWRLAIDEAQMVESQFSDSAQMVGKVQAVIRWAISGTPIGRGKVDDLFGLLSFLRFEPFCHKTTWQNAVQRPIEARLPGSLERLSTVIGSVLWRTTKSSVSSQLNLPPQTENLRILEFSSIEREFYKKQYSAVAALSKQAFKKAENTRNEDDQAKLCEGMLQLRQACCHPQVGIRGLGKTTGGRCPRVMSLSNINDHLVDRERIRGKEAIRNIIIAMNGIAALNLVELESMSKNAQIDPEMNKVLVNTNCAQNRLKLEAASLYNEIINITWEVRNPCSLTGESEIRGGHDFIGGGKLGDGRKIVKSGRSFSLSWKISNVDISSNGIINNSSGYLQAFIDVEKSKRLVGLNVRYGRFHSNVNEGPEVGQLFPKEIVLQALNSFCGEQFYTVAEFVLPPLKSCSDPNKTQIDNVEWVPLSEFRHIQSAYAKNWRILVKSCYTNLSNCNVNNPIDTSKNRAFQTNIKDNGLSTQSEIQTFQNLIVDNNQYFNEEKERNPPLNTGSSILVQDEYQPYMNDEKFQSLNKYIETGPKCRNQSIQENVWFMNTKRERRYTTQQNKSNFEHFTIDNNIYSIVGLELQLLESELDVDLLPLMHSVFNLKKIFQESDGDFLSNFESLEISKEEQKCGAVFPSLEKLIDMDESFWKTYTEKSRYLRRLALNELRASWEAVENGNCNLNYYTVQLTDCPSQYHTNHASTQLIDRSSLSGAMQHTRISTDGNPACIIVDSGIHQMDHDLDQNYGQRVNSSKRHQTGTRIDPRLKYRKNHSIHSQSNHYRKLQSPDCTLTSLKLNQIPQTNNSAKQIFGYSNHTDQFAGLNAARYKNHNREAPHTDDNDTGHITSPLNCCVSRLNEELPWWYCVLKKHEAAEEKSRIHTHAYSALFCTVEGAFRGKKVCRPFPNFSSVSELCTLLTTEIKNMEMTRTRVVKCIFELKEMPTVAEQLENTSCYQCRAEWGRTGPICFLCSLLEEIQKYSDFVCFDARANQPKELNTYKSNQSLQGFQTDSGLVAILKFLDKQISLSFDEKNLSEELKRQAKVDLNRIELIRKELSCMKELCSAQHNILSELDEINMATRRMQLGNVDMEEFSESDREQIVFPVEIDYKRAVFQVQLNDARDALNDIKSQLKYLHCQGSSTTTEDDCPICLDSIKENMVVSGCGHFYHRECINWYMCQIRGFKKGTVLHELSFMGMLGNFNCPKCRRVTPLSTMSFGTLLSENDGTKDVQVKGSWSTKVEALVGDLLSLPKGSKALVFSHWEEMLSIAEEALKENGVSFGRIKSKHDFAPVLEKFSQSKKYQIGNQCKGKDNLMQTDEPRTEVLLLNLKKSGQGLSLVEAQHVFLLEPILNAAVEAQAINRIHRIGQVHPTTVHRYIVKGKNLFAYMHTSISYECDVKLNAASN